MKVLPKNNAELKIVFPLFITLFGSVDLYIGPKAPTGNESNWLQTIEGEGWFPLFRTYGTEQAFFDKTCKVGEFEPIE